MSTDNSKLLAHPPTYPDFVEAMFSQLVSKWGISREVVIKEYLKEFEVSGNFATKQFPNTTPEKLLEMRQRYAIGKAFQMLIQRPPVSDQTYIFLGHQGKKLSKGGKAPYINAYVSVNEGGSMVIKRMVANGKYADTPLALVPLMIYTSSLGRFAEGGDFILDDRANIRPVQPSNLDIYALCEQLKIPIVTVEQAYQNPSKTVASTGYVVDTDWRCILGYVSGPPRTWKNKDAPADANIMSGVITITDMTVQEKPTVDNQGRTIMPGITGWSAPEYTTVDDGAYCAFLGPITKKKDATTGKETLTMAICQVIQLFSQTSGLEER
jgi:hypothetical protein